MSRGRFDPLPIVGLYGAPASWIAERYLATWRPEAVEVPFLPGMAVEDWAQEVAEVDELLRPSLIVATCMSDPEHIEAVRTLPTGLVLQTERRAGPNGFIAGARQVFYGLTLPEYTVDHALTATYLVIEAHIRQCRRKAGRSD